jgi:hypothetical protein
MAKVNPQVLRAMSLLKLQTKAKAKEARVADRLLDAIDSELTRWASDRTKNVLRLAKAYRLLKPVKS